MCYRSRLLSIITNSGTSGCWVCTQILCARSDFLPILKQPYSSINEDGTGQSSYLKMSASSRSICCRIVNNLRKTVFKPNTILDPNFMPIFRCRMVFIGVEMVECNPVGIYVLNSAASLSPITAASITYAPASWGAKPPFTILYKCSPVG